MAYDKNQIKAVADALLKAVDAVRDGVGVDDLDEVVGLLTSFGGAADEFKTDTDAAILHLAGFLADAVGDKRINVAA